MIVILLQFFCKMDNFTKEIQENDHEMLILWNSMNFFFGMPQHGHVISRCVIKGLHCTCISLMIYTSTLNYIIGMSHDTLTIKMLSEKLCSPTFQTMIA